MEYFQVKIIKMIPAVLSLMACLPPCLAGSQQQVYTAVTNYPNPFDSREGSTTICYTLTTDSEVKAVIYDLLGNVVREYPERFETAGIKTVVWDGTDQQGLKVSKGGYILTVEIKSGDSKTLATRKIGVIH